MATVVKRKERWWIDYYDQFQIRHREVGGRTKKEAELMLAKILEKIDKKGYRSKREIPLFKQLSEDWLKKEVENNLSVGSVIAYRSHVKNHLNKFFGNYKLYDIKTGFIERYLFHAVENKVSRYLANKTVTTLGTILKYAVRHGIIEYNPVRDVKRLARPSKEDHDTEIDERNILNPCEIKILLNNTPENYRPLLTTAVLTGMRQGELLGLKWGDFDWVNGQICVRRSFCRSRDPEGNLVFNIPKTKAGKRRIDMAPELVKVLKDWRVLKQANEAIAQANEKDRGIQLERQESTNRYDLVFPSPTGNPESHGNMLRKGFFPALKKAGVRRIRFHDLRHTYASLLIDQGENIEYIRSQLGHAKADITLRVYTHLFEKKNQGSATRLGAKVFGEVVSNQEGDLVTKW